jgi:hypothetical protein
MPSFHFALVGGASALLLLAGCNSDNSRAAGESANASQSGSGASAGVEGVTAAVGNGTTPAATLSPAADTVAGTASVSETVSGNSTSAVVTVTPPAKTGIPASSVSGSVPGASTTAVATIIPPANAEVGTPVVSTTVSSGVGSSVAANTIPGTPTDAELIANYPAQSYGGYTATTSDLGPERSNGTRWLILNPPVPPGAAAAGFHTLIYAIHPVVGDINILGSPDSSYYFVNGSPGQNKGDNSSYYTTTNGQLTLINPGSNTGASGLIMAAQTPYNDMPYAQTVSTLALLPAGSGYYFEGATTVSANDGNNWPALWIWTYEAMADNETAPWAELDLNEWGFNPGTGGSCASACGTLTSLTYWTGQTTRGGLAQLYSTKSFTMTNELIMGVAWDATNSQVEVWANGTKLGRILFSAANLPSSAWTAYHHFPLIGTNSHNYTGVPAFNYHVRYVAAWGAP